MEMLQLLFTISPFDEVFINVLTVLFTNGFGFQVAGRLIDQNRVAGYG
jgi:hypothetical protein